MKKMESDLQAAWEQTVVPRGQTFGMFLVKKWSFGLWKFDKFVLQKIRKYVVIYKPQNYTKSTTTQPRQKTTLISTEELQPWDLQMTIFSCLLQDKLAKFLQTERPLFWENVSNVPPYFFSGNWKSSTIRGGVWTVYMPCGLFNRSCSRKRKTKRKVGRLPLGAPSDWQLHPGPQFSLSLG